MICFIYSASATQSDPENADDGNDDDDVMNLVVFICIIVGSTLFCIMVLSLYIKFGANDFVIDDENVSKLNAKDLPLKAIKSESFVGSTAGGYSHHDSDVDNIEITPPVITNETSGNYAEHDSDVDNIELLPSMAINETAGNRVEYDADVDNIELEGIEEVKRGRRQSDCVPNKVGYTVENEDDNIDEKNVKVTEDIKTDYV